MFLWLNAPFLCSWQHFWLIAKPILWFFLVLTEWQPPVDAGISLKYKSQVSKPPLPLNTKNPGPYPSQPGPETPGLGFQNHCRRKGSASPTTQSAEGHKGTLYQKPPLTLSLETLRAPYLMQRIETNNPTTRLGGMVPFLFQPLFKTLLCFTFFIVDFQTIHRLNFVLNKVGALLKLYYKIVLTSSSFL